MSEARIWYSRDADQQNLPGECQNLIVEVLKLETPSDILARCLELAHSRYGDLLG